ncbi:MAG TPA: AMP-binding protein, partial [Dermatophilaceae bacterium]|nr:AMP-binding protein [Dermatophilaceae bacterium]
MTCTIVQEREQTRLYDAVSRAGRAGHAFAVLDPTWPKSFLAMAASQVGDAASSGLVADGDLVVFSSGSTGRPRGIVRTVESWQASVCALSDITGITAEDTVWLPGPLWSSLFLYGAFHARAVGAQLVFGDAEDHESARATALHCVPSQLPGLLHRARAGGLPLVRRVVVAGDHGAAPLRQQCEAAGWQVAEYYGAAELSFVAWRDRAGPFSDFPGVRTELRDGVLWARSPYLARGYLTDHHPIGNASGSVGSTNL